MICKNHGDREAVGACVYCGNLFCSECLIEINGRKYCREHAQKAIEEINASTVGESKSKNINLEKTETQAQTQIQTQTQTEDNIQDSMPKQQDNYVDSEDVMQGQQAAYSNGTDDGYNYEGNYSNTKSHYIGRNSENTLRAMVGNNSEFYMGVFRRIEDSGKGGCTPLALIWPLFMLYRKMYKEFFILLVMSLISFIPIVGSIYCIGLLIYMIINLRKLYYKSILRKLDKFNLTGKDVAVDYSAAQVANKIGGTTWAPIIIYLLSSIILSIIIAIFFTALHLGLRYSILGSRNTTLNTAQKRIVTSILKNGVSLKNKTNTSKLTQTPATSKSIAKTDKGNTSKSTRTPATSKSIAKTDKGNTSKSTQTPKTSTSVSKTGNSKYSEGAFVYKRYTNVRYEFSIDYPSFLNLGTPPDNGDGISMTSDDGEIELKVWGRYNIFEETPQQCYEEDKAKAYKLGYNVINNKSYVVSWEDENGRVYYLNSVVGESINTFIISYPKKYLNEFRPIVTRLYNSFKTPGIGDYR